MSSRPNVELVASVARRHRSAGADARGRSAGAAGRARTARRNPARQARAAARWLRSDRASLRRRLRAGAGGSGQPADHRYDLEVDAAAREGLRVQHRDQRAGDGDRDRLRHLARPRPTVARCAGGEDGVVRHPLLPQRALAGAAVLLHVPAAVQGHAVRRDDPAAGLGQGDVRPVAARDGEHVRDRARRGAVDPDRAMGIRRARSRSRAARRCG